MAANGVGLPMQHTFAVRTEAGLTFGTEMTVVDAAGPDTWRLSVRNGSDSFVDAWLEPAALEWSHFVIVGRDETIGSVTTYLVIPASVLQLDTNRVVREIQSTLASLYPGGRV